jgi:AraC-like DNA-binding protein
VYFVADGSGVLQTDHSEMTLEPGFAYIAPCGSKCGFYGTDNVTKLFFHINVLMPNGYDLFASCKDLARIPYQISQIEKLKRWYFSNDTIAQTLLKGAIWSVIGTFGEILGLSGDKNNDCSREVRSAVKYIRDHLTAGLSVNDVSSAAYVSSAVLTKKFQKELGVTPGKYIEDLIMQEAQTLLLCSDRTIGQISADLGFCDQFYFTRRFSARYGITPKNYRKNSARIQY